MAYTAGIIHPRPETVSNVFHSISDPLRNLAASYIKHRELRRAEAELRAMSNHALADIGISRCDIHNAVRTGRRGL